MGTRRLIIRLVTESVEAVWTTDSIGFCRTSVNQNYINDMVLVNQNQQDLALLP